MKKGDWKVTFLRNGIVSGAIFSLYGNNNLTPSSTLYQHVFQLENMTFQVFGRATLHFMNLSGWYLICTVETYTSILLYLRSSCTCSKCIHPIFLFNFWTYNTECNSHWRCTICDARWLFLAPEDSQMPWPRIFVNSMGWAFTRVFEKVGLFPSKGRLISWEFRGLTVSPRQYCETPPTRDTDSC